MSLKGIQTAYNKANKISYKHLNYAEKRLIKIDEKLEQATKFRDYCFSIMPRLSTNAVNWKEWKKNPNANNYFDTEKEIEKLHNSRENLIRKYNLNEQKVYNLFHSTQYNLSQSF